MTDQNDPENWKVAAFQTETGSLNPKLIWDQRDIWAKRTANSRKIFENLTDEQADNLISIVATALDRMKERIEDWVPEAITANGGDYLDLHLRFLFSDIERG